MASRIDWPIMLRDTAVVAVIGVLIGYLFKFNIDFERDGNGDSSASAMDVFYMFLLIMISAIIGLVLTKAITKSGVRLGADSMDYSSLYY